MSKTKATAKANFEKTTYQEALEQAIELQTEFLKNLPSQVLSDKVKK